MFQIIADEMMRPTVDPSPEHAHLRDIRAARRNAGSARRAAFRSRISVRVLWLGTSLLAALRVRPAKRGVAL